MCVCGTPKSSLIAMHGTCTGVSFVAPRSFFQVLQSRHCSNSCKAAVNCNWVSVQLSMCCSLIKINYMPMRLNSKPFDFLKYHCITTCPCSPGISRAKPGQFLVEEIPNLYYKSATFENISRDIFTSCIFYPFISNLVMAELMGFPRCQRTAANWAMQGQGFSLKCTHFHRCVYKILLCYA